MTTIKQEFVALLFTVFPQEQLNALPAEHIEEMEKLFMAGYQKAWERITLIVEKMEEAEAERIIAATSLELATFFEKLAPKPPQG